MAIVQLASGKHIDTDKLPAGMICRYGRVFKGLSKLQIELVAFREDWQPGPNGEPWGKGRYEHCKSLVHEIWPHYEYNPWSELMFRTFCENNLSALMGCTNSGKSRALAMYALLCWWSAPQDTAVAVTSTDIKSAKTRVWGHLVTAHGEARWRNDDETLSVVPGTITDQPELVRLKSSHDGIRGANQQAIQLVAAGNEVANAALRTLQGLHNRFVLLVLDELQDLTADIIGDALLLNLKSNDRFQICAAGNINEIDKPLGVFCKPALPEGYDDVNEETDSWPIEHVGMRGLCVRLDAEKSPNFARVRDGKPQWLRCPQVETVDANRKLYEAGIFEASAYYRQYKSYITPKALEEGLYSASVMKKFDATSKCIWQTDGGYLTIVGCDPSYTSGGDRFVLYPIHYGLANIGLWTIEFQEPILLQHEGKYDEVRNYDMVKQTIAICVDKLKVGPENFAVDNSGENALGDIFVKLWSDQILRVNFQGKPSELPASLTDNRPCSHVYQSKGAELWGTLAKFIRHNQVRGIGLEHQKELAARRTETAVGGKMKFEEKPKMRKRLNFSPDIADAGNVGVELLRVRHGAVAGAENTAETSRQLKQQQEKSMVLPVRLASQRGISRMWGR